MSEGTFSMINRILVWLVWYQRMDKGRGEVFVERVVESVGR